MKTQDTNFNPKMSLEPLEEKPTNEDVIKILGLTSTEEERTFFIKGYEYAKEKDKDELLLMVQDLEGYKSVVSSLESELKALNEEADRLKSELLDRDINQLPEKDAEIEALREEREGLFKLTVLAYESLSVVRTEPTMSGAVLSSFDKKKFITKYNLFFDALETFITSVEGKKLLEQFKAYTLNTEKN